MSLGLVVHLHLLEVQLPQITAALHVFVAVVGLLLEGPQGWHVQVRAHGRPVLSDRPAREPAAPVFVDRRVSMRR